jgi:HPt (histidine-containing phosphotransfer) domain-containing protein
VGGDHALLVELTQIFRAQVPKIQADIERSLKAGDAKALEQAAHTIRGSVASFGARRAVAAAQSNEQMAHLGQLQDVAPLIEELNRELIGLERDLQELVGSNVA